MTSFGDNDVRTHWQNDAHCAVGIHLAPIAKMHADDGKAGKP